MAELTRLFAELVAVEGGLRSAVDTRLRAQHGIQLNRYEILALIRARGTCQVRDLAAALSLSSGGASKLVDRLQDASLVVRRPNPDDRRSSLVALTADGESLVARASETLEDELQLRLGTVLRSDEFETLSSLLSLVMRTS